MTTGPSPEEKELLKQIAKLGGLYEFAYTSSSELATVLGVSQQTASRKILDLLDAGHLLRRMGTRKQLLRISASGIEILRRELAEYRTLFQTSERISVRGRVVAGLGEGRYYISREGYRKAFGRLLGFDPYPGTLNIEVDPSDREKVTELRGSPGILVEEFQSEGRTFGAVKCYRAQLRDAEAAAIFPVRSHHVNVLELISPQFLREALDLTDGMEVVVTLDLTPDPAGNPAKKL